MAKRLGDYRLWTPEETDRLERLYPGKDAGELAKLLGRTRREVHQKAKNMGVSNASPKGFMRVSSAALETRGGISNASLRAVAKREIELSGYKKIGNLIIIREDYAQKIIERYHAAGKARRIAEDKENGYLDINQVAVILGLSVKTISQYINNRKPRKSPAFVVVSALKFTRATNKHLRFNPYEIEDARRRLQILTEQRKRGQAVKDYGFAEDSAILPLWDSVNGGAVKPLT